MAGDRWGYIDTSGDGLFRPRFLDSTGINTARSGNVQNGENGCIDPSGNMVIEASMTISNSRIRTR